MSQRNRRPAAAALALVGFLSILPLSEVEGAPRVRAQRGQDLWQRVEQQASVFWGELGRIWQKVGARIDDNGSRIQIGTTLPDDGMTPVAKPMPSPQ